jgi:hypothetical protein
MDPVTRMVSQYQSKVETLTKECERLDQFPNMLFEQMGKDMQSLSKNFIRIDSLDIDHSTGLDSVERSTQILEQMVLPDSAQTGGGLGIGSDPSWSFSMNCSDLFF